MSQPNTAAIVVAAIFGGIALVFVAYKTYCKVWNWMHRSEQLPPISGPTTAYHGGVVMAGVGEVSTSEMASASIRALDSVVVSSASASTMTLKRSYLRSSSASQMSGMSSSSRRESYLPHSPRNRDSIQIVPPQPLGFGGCMAMAADQKTLAFSASSGVGMGEDLVGGLVWTEASVTRPQLAMEDRQRYLMVGPVSTRSEAPSVVHSSQSSAVVRSEALEKAAEDAEAKRLVMNPLVLGASDSPLQRLQSNTSGPPLEHGASSRSSSSRSRSSSSSSGGGGGGGGGGGDASPILGAFSPSTAQSGCHG